MFPPPQRIIAQGIFCAVAESVKNNINVKESFESLISESEDIIIEQNAFCSLPNLNFVDFSSITNGQFENNIFSLCPNITYLKLAKAKIKNSNEIDYILKNYGLIQNNNLTLEIASNFETPLQTYCNFMNGYAKHHDKTELNVLEYLMYQTGNIIRLLITLKQAEPAPDN